MWAQLAMSAFQAFSSSKNINVSGAQSSGGVMSGVGAFGGGGQFNFSGGVLGFDLDNPADIALAAGLIVAGTWLYQKKLRKYL